jgi:hypothetical protein
MFMKISKISCFVPFFLCAWMFVSVCFSCASHKTEAADEKVFEESSQSPNPPELSKPSSSPAGGFNLPRASFPARGYKLDVILSSYQDAFSRDQVVTFFGAITHSDEMAAIILANASAFNVSPSLAFALCWEESRYNPRAVNRKNRNETVDRGLFQLNCRSFPLLTEEDFFNPSINAYYAMAHLRWCLDTAGSEVAGLAMYNAGTTRVRQNGTPKNTLDYISRVLEYQNRVEEFFRSEYMMTISMSPR